MTGGMDNAMAEPAMTAGSADPFAGLVAAAQAAPAAGALAALRHGAAAAYLGHGLPTRRDESWKYTDLKRLRGAALRAAATADVVRPVERLPQLIAADRSAGRLVFVNGGFRADLSSVGDAPASVRVRPLAAALEADPGDLLAVLADVPALPPLPLVALNTALFADGACIDVGATADAVRGAAADVDVPWLELVFLADGGAIATALRHVIRLGAGARLGIVEHHLGGDGGTGFANGVTQIALAERAALRHYRVIEGGGETARVLTTVADVGAGADYECFTLTLGGAFSRIEADVHLAGPGAHCRIAGSYAIDGREFCDNTSNVWHRCPRTTSRQVYKGVIDGAARAVFQGRIVVEADAQESDGHQLSKALLLSDEAEIDQKPALEIAADNVKCSHGAAAGQLDAEALFYLRSRGLPEPIARQMLLEGFLADVLLEVSDAAIREALRERLIGFVHGLGGGGR